MSKKKKEQKKQTNMDLGISKNNLESLSKIIPEEPKEEPQEVPQEKPNLPGEQLATGSIAKLFCFGTNIVLSKINKEKLTEKEVELLTSPINEIEAKYFPALLAKYTDKASPFIELSMALFMVYEARKPKEQPKEKQQENQDKPQEAPAQ